MKKFLVSFAVFAATAGTAYADSLNIGSPQINVPTSINVALPVQVQTGVALGLGIFGTGSAGVGQLAGQSANAQQLINNLLNHSSFNP